MATRTKNSDAVARPWWRSLMLVALSAVAASTHAQPLCVLDDAEQKLCLAAPAQRIVSLSPGATELLFDAGAGQLVVGTVSFSDYPDAAKDIARIGSYNRLDLESLLALKPDLVVAWRSGNPRAQVERLQRLGVPVYYTEPRSFAQIASTVSRLGRLAGRQESADAVAAGFTQEVSALAEQYAKAEPVKVFYQIWDEPLMTINDTHFISEAIRLCGGENIFAALPRLTPTLDPEAVLRADPQAIIAGGMGEAEQAWAMAWRRYDGLQAVRKGHLFFIPPSLLQRPTLRLLAGTRTLCDQLQVVRNAD